MKVPILLSQNKISQIEKELKTLKESLKKENEGNIGSVHSSHKEAASFELVLKAKELKIKELEDIIAGAKILEEGHIDKETGIGKEIEVELPNGNKRKVKLVHPIEADPSSNLLSIDSPLAKES